MTNRDVPTLSGGSHVDPDDGMCVMEYVSWKYGLGFNDLPSCTEYAIAAVAQNVNDMLAHQGRDDDLARLALRADRLFDAHPVKDEAVRRRVLVRLAESMGCQLRKPSISRGPFNLAQELWVQLMSTAALNEDDLVDWLDRVLDAYEKARAEEGVLHETFTVPPRKKPKAVVQAWENNNEDEEVAS